MPIYNDSTHKQQQPPLTGRENLRVLLRRLDFLRNLIRRDVLIRSQLIEAHAKKADCDAVNRSLFLNGREATALEWAIQQITGKDISPQALAAAKDAGPVLVQKAGGQ